MKNFCLFLAVLFATQTHAQTNYALNFTGSNYVDCGSSSSFDANNIRTMECWVKFGSFTGGQEILAKSIGGQGVELLVFNNSIAVYCMYNGSNYSFLSYATSNLQTGIWYHLAFSWNGTKENMRLYINGVSVGSRTDVGNINTTGLTNPSGSFRIANWADPSTRYFTGVIDEVRIWNTNRTAAEIKAAMYAVDAASTGLVAYYKMNNGTGSILTNSTATAGLDGTLISSPTWASSPVGKSANAISLDGSDDYVNLGTSSTLKFTNNFSLEFWVRSANWAVSTQAQLVSCFESGGYGITLTTNGMLNFQIRTPTSGGYIGVSYPVSNLVNNTWYHVAGTFDGRYMRLYVNGALAGTYDLGTTGNTVYYSYPSNALFVGADPTQTSTPQGFYFDGEMDEVRLWSSVRTQGQIQDNMSKEVDPSLQTNLVSYYTFNGGIASGTNTGLTTVVDQSGTNNGTLINLAMTSGSSNFVVQQSSLVVLPLKWHAFTAQKQQGAVLLQWSTLQEQHTKEFSIQHSRDGLTWTPVGSLPAAGNSLAMRQYAFVHRQPFAGINFYRILQTDGDGRQNFSGIQKLVFENAHASFRLQTNIATGGLLQVQADRAMELSIFQTDGRLILQKNIPAGNTAIETTNFAKGIYWIRGGAWAEKFIVR